MDKQGLRIIGIVAHIDAGKTTLTEQLLYQSGSIRTLGSVDKGTAHTDNLEVEQQRGISVRAAEAVLNWRDTEIHVIDTPGHIDFVAEVERALRILDGAILVISAVEGVQPQTEVYYKALKSMNIPTIIFINKIDRIGADIDRVLEEIKKMLTKDAVPFQLVLGQETQNPEVLTVFEKDYAAQIEMKGIKEQYEILYTKITETIADNDEEILQKYLESEEIPPESLKSKAVSLVHQGTLCPVFYGAALKGAGVKEILAALITYLPAPKAKEEDEVSAVVFKIEQHKTFGKMAYARLYGGKIQTRDSLYNYTKDVEEKITLMRKLGGTKEQDVGQATAGEIVSIGGLSKVSIGDILGSPHNIPKVPSIAQPLLTIQVFPEEVAQYPQLVEVFQQLEEEDPFLHVQWIREKKELHVQIMGTVQLEILQSLLKSRFDLNVTFGKPSVIYKETPLQKGTGFAAYTMPKPCWAIVKFEIEPLSSGSGLVYESRVRTEHIKVRYQREVERALPKVLEQGIYGWQVIDLKVTLIEGQDHYMHSNSGDFLIATPMAIMEGLSSIGTSLLEPIIKFRISAPEEAGGKILNDLVQMRGSFDSPVIAKGNFTVEGEMPVATSLEYPIRLGIISGGRGLITTQFAGYKPCPLERGATRERVGVNPLDRAKFILAMRNAIDR